MNCGLHFDGSSALLPYAVWRNHHLCVHKAYINFPCLTGAIKSHLCSTGEEFALCGWMSFLVCRSSKFLAFFARYFGYTS